MQFMKQALVRTVAAAAMLAALGIGSSARAQTTALTFTSNTGTAFINGYTLGWSFSVSSTITVNRLGVWDRLADGVGLQSSHLINIWDGAGTALLPLSTTVPAGAGGDAVVPSGSFEGGGVFRFYNVAAPVVLTAGTYTIGANYSSSNLDNVAVNTSTPIMSGPITFGTPGLFNASGNSIARPTSQDPSFGNSFFGPNFQFALGGTSSAAPEPGSLALAAMGIAGTVAARRRKRA